MVQRQHAVSHAEDYAGNCVAHLGFLGGEQHVDTPNSQRRGIIVPVTSTVNITCDGTSERPHPNDVRTAAQFHDKYATSWELTPNFGSGYGAERKTLRVPGAASGDERRMRLVIECPDPLCILRKAVRWEKLHAELDRARDLGYSRIPVKLLAEE